VPGETPESDRWIDLHLHSSASDGLLTPSELMAGAAEGHLAAVALTDHDTTAGLGEAAEAAQAHGVDFVPGVEFSVTYDPGVMHLLAYYFDAGDGDLVAACQRLVEAREVRNRKIVDRLVDLGCDISYQQVRQIACGESVGRPHIARVLVQSRCVRTLKQAFTKYLAKGEEAYVSREKLSAAEAVRVIRGAGGVVALAHPTQLRCRTLAELNQVVAGLVDLGVEAIEVYHPDHRPEDVRVCMDLARRYGLLMTGGSDFHGPMGRSRHRVGFSSNRIPYEWLTELQKCVAGRRAGRTG